MIVPYMATLILDAEYSHPILICLHPVFANVPIFPTFAFFFVLLHCIYDHMLSKRIDHPPLTHIIHRPLYIESSHCSFLTTQFAALKKNTISILSQMLAKKR